MNLALLELYASRPKAIYITLLLLLALYFFICRQFTLAPRRKADVWRYLALPAYFSASLTLFSALLSNRAVLQSLILLDTVFIYLYFRILYNYFFNKQAFKGYAFDNIAVLGNFLSVYFISSGIYGLQAFLNLPVWVLILIFIFFIYFIINQFFWTLKLDKATSLFYSLVMVLLMVELAWTVSFLTLSYYVLGLILAECYYILAGLSKYYLLGKLEARVIKLYLGFGLSTIILVLLTARWM